MEPVAVDISVDIEAVAARLGVLAGERLTRALSGGLAEGLEYAAGEVVLDAHAKGVQSRSGQLLNAVRGELDQDGGLAGHVGVPQDSPAIDYAHLLTDADFTIVPYGEYLAIPIGPNLTGAGVARFSSPRQLAGGKFRRGVETEIPWGDGTFRGLVFGIGDGDAFEAYFALVRSVHARGKDVLEPAVEGARDTMTETVDEHVAALLEETR
jgi:hypothetical protein